MKKLITLLIAFVLSFSCMSQKYKVVYKRGNSGMPPFAIYNNSTQKLLSDYVYHDVDIVENSFFIVQNEKEYVQVLDTNMQELLPDNKYAKASVSTSNPRFITVKGFHEKFKDKERYGVYDCQSKMEMVPLSYDYIGKVNKNGYAPFNKGGKDMMPQLVQGGKWGYLYVINNKITLEPTYSWCSTLNDFNVGRVYVGGSSSDGLYGGFWTLVDEKGTLLIDQQKYGVQEGAYYNTPPMTTVQLKDKSQHSKTVLFNTNTKNIKKYDYIISSEVPEFDLFIVKNKSYGGKYGIMNAAGKLIKPIEYRSIYEMDGQLLLNKPEDSLQLYDLTKKITKILPIKDINIKCSSETYNDSPKEEVCVILGTNASGKIDVYNQNLKLVIKDVEKPFYHGYDQDYYAIYDYEKYGSVFGYTKDGAVNYYSLDQDKIIFDHEYQHLGKNADYLLNGKSYNKDSVFVKKNDKWGLMSTQTLQSGSFVYDSLIHVNDKVIVAEKGDHLELLVDGSKIPNFPEFDELLSFNNEGRYIPGREGVYNPYSHLLIDKDGQRYLIQFTSSGYYNKDFDEMVLDKGNITKVEDAMYVKDGQPYNIFSKARLPEGTVSSNGLDDWTSKSDIPIYNYQVGDLYGIVDENGKVIFKPKYKVEMHYTTYPPADFKYQSKK